MVYAMKIALLWAVALLVCSGVPSYGEEIQATITQVSLETKTTESTAAPAITTTTAGSDTTQNAVLAGSHLTTEGVPLVLVDLARSHQEKTSVIPALTAVAPVAVPEGFDMNELSDEEAPATSDDPVVPEGVYANEFAEDVTPGSADVGHEVTGFPAIPETDDKSFGEGYGVVAPQTVDEAPAAESFATSEDVTPGQTAAGAGHVVTGFPTIPEGADNTHGAGYGVVTPQTADATPGAGESFAAATEGTPAGGEGHVVTGFPTIPEGADNTYGAGYGVVTPQTADATPGAGESFAAAQGDEFAAATEGTPAGGEGHVVTGFPTIPEGADNTHGAGYGVLTPQTADASPGAGESFAATEGDEFTAAAEDTPAGGEGHVVTGFPTIPDGADNTYGAGYGVVAPQTAEDTPGSSESFSSYVEGQFNVASEDAPAGGAGHVVTGFPAIPDTADNTYGAGYGVVAPQSFAVGDSFGVQSDEEDVDADPAQSFAAAGDGGFQVTGFPTEIGGEGSSFAAYGDAAGDSFADFEGGQFSAQSVGGQQLQGFPDLESFSTESSQGNPYGRVRPLGPFYGRP